MEISGKIIVLGNTETIGSAGTFKKRTVVIETDEQYKQTIPIDFLQDKCSSLDNYSVGQNVKISINIRGNEYQGKYYVSLNGWRIDKLDSQQASVNQMPPMPSAEAFAPATDFKEEEHPDLPF